MGNIKVTLLALFMAATTAFGQTKFGQDITLLDGVTRMTLNMSEVYFMVDRSDGGTSIYYGPQLRLFDTRSTLLEMTSASCDNFVTIPIIFNSSNRNAAINIANFERVDKPKGTAKTRIILKNGSLFETTQTYGVVQNLFDVCLSGTPGGATIDSVVVRSTSSGITAKVNTVQSLPVKVLPASIAQGGASLNQILRWDGTAWAPATISGGVPDGNFGDVTVSGSGSTWNINTGVVGANELASSGVSPGVYGDNFSVPVITVDTDGRITSASTASIFDVAANNEGVLGWSASGGTNSTTAIMTSNTSGASGTAFIAGTGLAFTKVAASNGGSLTINTTGLTNVSSPISGNGTSGSPLTIAANAILLSRLNQGSATTGQVIKWNGSSWAPAADNASGSISSAYPLDGSGSVGDPVTIADPGTFDERFMFWNGSSWDVAPIYTAGGSITGEGNTSLPITLARQGAADGQTLKWDDGLLDWFPGNDIGSSNTIAAFSISGNARGISATDDSLRLHAATATTPGGLSTGTQTVSGDKTFQQTSIGVTTPVIVSNNADSDGQGVGYGFRNAGLTDATIVLSNPAGTYTRELSVKVSNGSSLEDFQVINGTARFTTFNNANLFEIENATTSSWQADGRVSHINASSSVTTISLPEIVSGAVIANQVSPGFELYISNTQGSSISVVRSGADTIGAATSITVNANSGVILRAVSLDKWIQF